FDLLQRQSPELSVLKMDFVSIPLLIQGRIFGLLPPKDLLSLKQTSRAMNAAVSTFVIPTPVEGVAHPMASIQLEYMKRLGCGSSNHGHEFALVSKANDDSPVHPPCKISLAMKKALECILGFDQRLRTPTAFFSIDDLLGPPNQEDTVYPLVWFSRCGSVMRRASEPFPDSSLLYHDHHPLPVPDEAIRVGSDKLLALIHGQLLYLDLKNDRLVWHKHQVRWSKMFGLNVRSQQTYSFCLRHIDMASRYGNFVKLYQEDLLAGTNHRHGSVAHNWTGVSVHIYTNWDAPESATDHALQRGVRIETPASKFQNAVRTLEFELEDIRTMWLDTVDDDGDDDDGQEEVLHILVHRHFGRKYRWFTLSMTEPAPKLRLMLTVTSDIKHVLSEAPKPVPTVVWNFCHVEKKMKCIIPNFERDFGPQALFTARQSRFQEPPPFEKWLSQSWAKRDPILQRNVYRLIYPFFPYQSSRPEYMS
ncbi:hypothetical protein TCAL_12956, partial [Tigriopus californicus]